MYILVLLKFTPLEFETSTTRKSRNNFYALKFTPLEFETGLSRIYNVATFVKIYSVGV